VEGSTTYVLTATADPESCCGWLKYTIDPDWVIDARKNVSVNREGGAKEPSGAISKV
jgi:hypothetical protein